MAIPPPTPWAGAGLQTAGKTYLARPYNIEKYTQGRFCPTGLATEAAPAAGASNPERGFLPAIDPIDPNFITGLLMHDEDLDLGHIFSAGLTLTATALLPRQSTPPLLETAPKVHRFAQKTQSDALGRFGPQIQPCSAPKDLADLVQWAHSNRLQQIITPYAPVGDIATHLSEAKRVLRPLGISLIQKMAPYDRLIWPHAAHGFFALKTKYRLLLIRLKRRRGWPKPAFHTPCPVRLHRAINTV